VSRRRIATTAALVATGIAIVIGIPAGLVALAGSPIPAGLPTAGGVARALTNGDVDPATLLDVLAFVCWVAWAQLAAALVIETLAAAVGRPSVPP